ncbi:MAG TPA: hypothetical protein VNW54_00170 [Granulicella sp.]|nr:hypothetical protein [Granulicella sp.]
MPAYNFAGRPTPPSLLQERVLVGLTTNGTTGELEILDGLRDLRSNIQYTKPTFSISGYSSGYPSLILNFPEESKGYAYSNSDGSLININYGTEAAAGPAATLPALSTAIAAPPTFTRIYSAEPTAGFLVLVDNTTGGTYALNLPNVNQVVANAGDTVALAMVRNSNYLYRIFKLNTNQYQTSLQAIAATGAVDCQPYNLPIYCVVPVPGKFDHPSNAYFSLDGTQAYVLNSGPELGGTTASVSVIPQSQLVNTLYATSPQAPAGYLPPTSPIPSPTNPSPVSQQILVPGGVTTAISDGTTLYVAGQSPYVVGSNGASTTTPNPNGLFAGYLTTINQATNQITAAYSISDGSHSQMLFADDNTLWIGSANCANGVRQYNFVRTGTMSEATNYNCLTMFNTSTLAPLIVPALTTGTGVSYPNTYQTDMNYYGNIGGVAWVQNYHKVYTAYGGQIHSFNTTDGSERTNTNITVQGTALTVVYMDALTNLAN